MRLSSSFINKFVVDRLCYSAKGLITVSGFCKPPDADADDIELWLPVANGERSLNVDTAKYVVSLLSDCFTQLLDDENKASALDSRYGIAKAKSRSSANVKRTAPPQISGS